MRIQWIGIRLTKTFLFATRRGAPEKDDSLFRVVDALPKRALIGKQRSQERVISTWLTYGGLGGLRPTLPRPRGRSTIGAEELNDRVRDGNGCGLLAKATPPNRLLGGALNRPARL